MAMKSDFYVYIHRLEELGLPFYVGKGRGDRINRKQNRNKYWHHVVNAYGFTAEYVSDVCRGELKKTKGWSFKYVQE